MNMFLEPGFPPSDTGWIEVICGSMFSGKTEELIRRLKRAEIAGMEVRIFKPHIDQRYSKDAIVSHNKNSLQSIMVKSSQELYELAKGTEVVGIDEAQFFDEGIVEVVNRLANEGSRVVIAGLDMDYTGKPFGPMPYLLAIAEFVTKLHAICTRTGQMAHYSLRKTKNKQGQILTGEKEHYEPVSREVFKFEMGLMPRPKKVR